MKQKTLLCVGAVAFALSAITATAQSLTVKLNSLTPALTVRGTFNGGSVTEDYRSGVFNFAIPPSTNDEFSAFCVEPTSTITVGQTLTYNVASLASLTNSDKVARLVGGFLASNQTSADAAAVQWAIWEVTSETANSFDLGSNKVKISSSGDSTKSLGNDYLSKINTYTAAHVTYLKNSQYQNMIAWNYDCESVPEPTSLSLLALSGALLLRRKRK